MKMNSEIDRAQPKKPYEAPQLFEHGTIEKITGEHGLPVAFSGLPDAFVISK